MHSSITAVVNLYKTNTDLLFRFLEGLPENKEFTRPDEKANSANWIVGHLLNTRFEINKFAGAEGDCKWCELYCNGSKIQDSSVYPSISEMKPVWESVSKTMIEKISSLTENDLSAASELGVPNPDKDLRGLLGFFAFHEGMHMGQIVYLKRLLG